MTDDHREHLRRGFNWLGGATIAAKVIDFSTILIVLLFLTKAQVGTASIVIAVAMVVEAFDGLGTGEALIQVCATLPDNFIAFEYAARFEPFWYEITQGFDGVPVRNGMIDVPDRPGMGVELIAAAARAHVTEGDADFFD